MSLVSHDSLWIRQILKIRGYNHEEEIVEGESERGQSCDKGICKDDDDKRFYTYNREKENILENELSKGIDDVFADNALNWCKTDGINYNIDTFNKINDVASKNNITDKNLIDVTKNVTNYRYIPPVIKRNEKNELEKKTAQDDGKSFKESLEKDNHYQQSRNNVEKEIWSKQNRGKCWLINFAGRTTKATKVTYQRQPNLCLNSGVCISLVMLIISGVTSAADSSGFSSGLTSRMIASFLGYPSTCSLGIEVHPCTLTFTCWLRGGTRLRGCGGWLFSCCGTPEPSKEGLDNSIKSSDWKYKMSPPKLRQVPQRSVMPNNVFRRRVDDSVSQMDCGLSSSRILQKRIIGGREARFAEFPWQAHVRISEFQCGGVLVSRRYVATAAHCVSRAHTRDIVVWLGAVDTSVTHHPSRKLGVVQKILHPLFQFRMTQPDRYDIALLKLSRPITYMSHILPICLPDYDMELRGRSGVIAGWGKTDASNSHTGTNILRSATVPILSKEQCINWHQSKQISVEIHSEMICAGHSDGHQDACLGDSGGPLIVLDNGRYYLVGITSAGFGCGVDHQPGIYHNVKLTSNWIRGVISPSVNYIDV